MDWQRHLEERAARYADIARSAADPRRRVQAKLTAREYEMALTACNTREADPGCPFAPGHWMRQGCRRTRTGSCAMVEVAAPAAKREENSPRVA